MNDVHIVTVFNWYDVTSYLFATETETLTLTLTHILTSHRRAHSQYFFRLTQNFVKCIKYIDELLSILLTKI